MKIISLIFFIVFLSNANARPLSNLSDSQIKSKYYQALKETPDNQKIFIRGNTIECSTIKSLKKIINRVSDGMSIYQQDLRNLNCSLMGGRAIGIVAGIEGDFYYLIYELPFSNKEVGYGYFYNQTLTTVEERKSRHS